MPRDKGAPRPDAPITSYEQFMDRIAELYPSMSSGFKQIARFVIQNPNYVAMNSVNTIAKSCGSHASSVVRFAQSCGFAGYKQLQSVFQLRLSTTMPGFQERLRALDVSVPDNDGRNRAFLRKSTSRDIAALEELAGSISEGDLTRAAEYLLKARTVFVSAQLESEGIASLLRYVLAKLGRRVILLDAAGGLAVEMANAMTPEDVLVAVSFRYYAKEVVTISGTAFRVGTPTIVITDSPLSPLARNVEVVFVVAQEEPSISPSLAAPISLVQSLGLAVAALLKDTPIGEVQSKSPRTPWRE